MSTHCHIKVAQVAREAAGALYETLMGENAIRDEWKRQNPGLTERQLLSRFIARNWARCIPFARATMATMLAGPLDEGLKAEIHDALIKDRSLRPLETSRRASVEILNREALK